MWSLVIANWLHSLLWPARLFVAIFFALIDVELFPNVDDSTVEGGLHWYLSLAPPPHS